MEEKDFRRLFPASVLRVFVQRFEEEADGAESVVAGDHGGFRVFHPAVVEIFAAVREREDERGNGVPGVVAESFGTRPAVADEDLPQHHAAGVFDRVFVLRDQVVVTDDLPDRDPDFLHPGLRLHRVGDDAADAVDVLRLEIGVHRQGEDVGGARLETGMSPFL